MNRLRRPLAVLIVAGLLAACGGGSGGGDDDDDSDTLRISGTSPDIARDRGSYQFRPTVDSGTTSGLFYEIENQPPWTDFDPLTGELSGEPEAGDVGEYPDIVITVSDGTASASLPPFTLTVLHAEIAEQDIALQPGGMVTDTDDGFILEGDAEITVGGRVLTLINASLEFEFDEDGKLVNVTGQVDLPAEISENLAIDTSVRAEVGMFTGAELNLHPDFGPDSARGILLRDDFRFFVFWFTAAVDVVISVDEDAEPMSFGGPSAEVFIVSDPTDGFVYMYSSSPLTTFPLGFGFSLFKNIPYQPIPIPADTIDAEPLDAFDKGQLVVRGQIPFGGGPLHSYEFDGSLVCQPPQIIGCTKPNLRTLAGIGLALGGALFGIQQDGGIDPTQQYKLGITGSTAFQLSLLGFIQLFEYHLFDMSATADIGTDIIGLTMLGVVDPQESEQPDWIPFEPVPAIDGQMVAFMNSEFYTEHTLIGPPIAVQTEITGGDFQLGLYGDIDSIFPPARMQGEINVDPTGMALFGTIDDDVNPITVSAMIDGDGMEAAIEFGYDIAGNLDAVTLDGFDNAVETVNQALEDLDDAIGGYNGAVSLNGFRTALPGILDDTIDVLDGIPQRIYNTVYTNTRDGINDDQYCYTVLGVTACANDILNATAEATASATTTRNVARANVDPIIADLEALKVEAERAEDTPAFRAALKDALITAASYDQYSQYVLVQRNVNFPFPIPDRLIVFYETTLRYTIFDAATRADLLTAANNVDDIDPAQTVMIDTQNYVDSLPTEAALEQARGEVEAGTRAIPAFNGAGYAVTSAGEQSVFVDLGEDRIEIAFNPLDPQSVVDNIGELIAKRLAD